MELGYACINMTLSKDNITTNRGMIKRTFDEKGLEYVSELLIQNLKDLITIIQWNYNNNINFYRMSSDIMPWMSEYKLEELPNFKEIEFLLKKAGEISKESNQRLTFHPGPFNVLCSPKDSVVLKTIQELNNHAKIMDLMELEETQHNKINIHVGGAYGDKESALKRWVENFQLLNDSTKNRLTIENDDKTSCYTVEDLMYIFENTGVPIVFDYHHHTCHSNGMSHKDALVLAMKTWSDNITPIVHVSEPRDEKNFKAHHDYVIQKIETFGYNVDIMLEAKMKELALIKYRELHSLNSI
jgi:UV DNA damage endonuclease